MPHQPYPNRTRARRRLHAETPAVSVAEPQRTVEQPAMARRSWYLPTESGQALADAIEELHYAVRRPKYTVLAELVAVALEHLPEVVDRLNRAEHQTSPPPPAARSARPVPPQQRIAFGSYIDPDLHKELKVACAGENVEIRDALDQALRLWLSTRPAATSAAQLPLV